jgi:hypothetical protein
MASAATDWQRATGILETIASIFHVIPATNADGKLLGVGVTIRVTSARIGPDILVAYPDDELRPRHTGLCAERYNLHAYEVKNIDKQILAQNIRVDLADHKIVVQQQLMDNSAGINDVLRIKYTNVELYQWLQGGIQNLYYQLYTMAHDWAKKAELAFASSTVSTRPISSSSATGSQAMAVYCRVTGYS